MDEHLKKIKEPSLKKKWSYWLKPNKVTLTDYECYCIPDNLDYYHVLDYTPLSLLEQLDAYDKLYEPEPITFKCINTEGPYTPYHPFDYYHSHVPNEVVEYILNDSRFGAQQFYLHTLFASLDATDHTQIIRWTEHFGTLIRSDKFLNSSAIGVNQSLIIFQGMLKRFQDIIDLHSLIKSLDDVRLKSYLHDYFFNIKTKEEALGGIRNVRNIVEQKDMIGTETLYITSQLQSSKEELNKWIDSAPYSLANRILETNLYLEDITPSLVFPPIHGNESKPGNHYVQPYYTWQCEELISAIYLMFLLDITSGKPPKKCANKYCNIVFPPTRDGKIYCTDECKNRVRQQRHRAKAKSVRKRDENVQQNTQTR